MDIAGGMLAQVDSSSETCLLLCELLASLADLKPGVLRPLIPDIQQALTTTCESLQSALTEERKQLQKVALLLCTLLFQTFKGALWMEEVLQAVYQCADAVDAWCRYRLARGACRFGHHKIASKVMNMAAEDAASEQMYFWIRGLAKVFQGEDAVSNVKNRDLVERVDEGTSFIIKGSTLIKASTSPYRNQEFQTR